LLATCLLLTGPLIAGSAGAEGDSPAAAGVAKPIENAVQPNRLNWPSAWTSQINDADGNASGAPPPAPIPADASSQAPSADPGQAPAVAQGPQPDAPAAAPAQPAAGTPRSDQQAQVPGAPPNQAVPGQAPSTSAPAAQAPAAPAPAATTPAAPTQAAPQVQPKPVQLKSQVAQDVEATKAVATRIESVTKSVERVSDRDEQLTELLPTIEKIIADAKATGLKLQPALADVRSQIEKLGPAPSDAKTEADEIAAERKRLEAVAAEIDGAIKTTELTQVRGRQLITRIQEIRLNNFRKGLSTRTTSILSPGIWRDALAALPDAGKQFVSISKEWAGRVDNRSAEVLVVVGLALVFGLGLQLFSRRARVRLRAAAGGDTPTFAQRCIVAGLEAPMRMLPKIVLATILFVGLNSLNLLYLQIGGLAAAAFKAAVIAAAGLAFTTTYLQPGRTAWRVIDLGDPAAWQARAVIRLGVILFAVDVVIRQLISELALPLPVNILWTSLAALSFAIIFLIGARITLAVPESGSARIALLGGHVHKAPLLLTAAGIVLAVLTGYVALGHFIATRLLILAAAIFLLVIVYFANRAIAREPDQSLPATAVVQGGSAEGLPGLPLDIRRRLARGLSILLDIVLFFIAVPVLLIALGFAPPEISTLIKQAVFGFVIGGVEISLFRVGIALGLFAGIVFLSRMLERWLGDTVLHPSRTEQGLGNSIRTGVGYLGFLIAAISGLSYAGLDITNLAIVAGALSVGIGFGLQSIVNNFVSGLILLVERPIKVGDWIKVGELQGYVRKISVRSTEIETFDRASVIIPNSELISGTVINMTLRNALGRISIPVGVSYDSDPDVVQKLLLECAAESDLVARHPAPFVVFENFGNSSLDFSLRIFVSDVSTSLATQTQVRKAILAKFRAAGIEIPFPQQDLNVRDVDGLKAAVMQLLADRQAPLGSIATPAGAPGRGPTGSETG